jgi:hypothetical protein
VEEQVMTQATEIRAGMRLSEVLALTVAPELLARTDIVVLNHGILILEPDNYFLHDDDRILVGILPQGGGGDPKKGQRNKSIGSIVIGLVLIVVGVYTDNPNLIVMGAGLMLGGVSGLLIKPPSVGTNTQSESQQTSTYGISGQSNAARPYQACLKIYGEYKLFPPIAANPNISNVGVESIIAAIYDFGIGNVMVTDIRIGDTPISQFDPETRLYPNVIDMQPELSNVKVAYDQFNFVLQKDQPLTLTTNPDTWLAELTLTFPQGLVQYNESGTPGATSVRFYGRWREVGGEWTDIRVDQVKGMQALYIRSATGDIVNNTVPDDGFVFVTGAGEDISAYTDHYTWRGEDMGAVPATQPLIVNYEKFGFQPPIILSRAPGRTVTGIYRLQISYNDAAYEYFPGFIIYEMTTRPKSASLYLQFPKSGQYEIELTRITPISADTKLFNSAAVTVLKSNVTGPMFQLRQPHTMLEVRLLASEKISGVIQNLTAIAQGILPTYDGAGNLVGEIPTRNPAWCALDVLIGSATPKPVAHSLIDWPSWYALAQYCDEPRTWIINGEEITAPRHTCDMVIDFVAPIKDVIDSLLSCCRASLIFTQTGKYGVLIDQRNDVPRQVITPTNSWDFSGQRTYADEVHALRVSFIDRDRGYQRQEIIVYKDGYDISNATRFEELATAGITEWFRAWAYGRYMMAQVIERSESFSLKMDIEHLAVQRGDLVYVQHDVPKIGGYSTRVVAVSGDDVLIAQDLSLAPSAYTVRLQDGTIRQGAVTAVVSGHEFTLDDATGILPDDLFVLGTVDKVTRPYVVQAIQPQSDMVAQLSLVVYEPAIYDADTGPLPVWNPGFGDDLINATALAVTSVTLVNELVFIDRRPIQQVLINFTVNSPFFAYAEIWLNIPNQRPELVDRTETFQGLHTFSLIASFERTMLELTYTVTPFTNTSLQGTSMSASTVPLENLPPSAPSAFDLDVKRETITLIWSESADQDVLAYEIWYDPRFDSAALSGATRLTPSVPWPARTFEVPLRLGTYFIRSIDSAGQVSEDYAVAFTPTDTLWNLNVIAQWDDKPELWPGLKSGFTVNADDDLITLPLGDGSFPARSEYYYNEIYDGGDIFQTRFTSKINGSAYSTNAFMAAWTPLAIAQPIGGWTLDGSGNQVAITGNVNIWHEIRWINSAGAMIDWTPLAIASPIGWGRSDVGIWRHFQVGDYIGRLFQFRLIAEYIGGAAQPDAGVIIDAATIDIDMPDRTDGDYNVPCPAGGFTVLYDPAFMVRPALSITPDLAASGERYAITAADAAGFHIQFLNAGGAGIARNFDWIAKGYGARGSQNITGLYRAPPLRARQSTRRQVSRPGNGPLKISRRL